MKYKLIFLTIEALGIINICYIETLQTNLVKVTDLDQIKCLNKILRKLHKNVLAKFSDILQIEIN